MKGAAGGKKIAPAAKKWGILSIVSEVSRPVFSYTPPQQKVAWWRLVQLGGPDPPPQQVAFAAGGVRPPPSGWRLQLGGLDPPSVYFLGAIFFQPAACMKIKAHRRCCRRQIFAPAEKNGEFSA